MLHLCLQLGKYILSLWTVQERVMSVDWLVSMLLRAAALRSKVATSTPRCKAFNWPASHVALLWH